MPDTDTDDGGDAVARRAHRLEELVAQLRRVNRSLAPAMTEREFDAMVQRMAEQQLLYEEFGSEG
jgi:hypothetical protein